MPNEEPISIASSSNEFGLNPIERQLIALTVAGYSSEESTRRLGISESALRQHLMNIFGKLQVSDRLELVLFALYHRLTEDVQWSPRSH